MIVPFKNLPPESRVWVFPSDRPFREEELGKLKEALTNFLSSWTAHNQELEAGFDLPYNRFIILGLNQEKSKPADVQLMLLSILSKNLKRYLNFLF